MIFTIFILGVFLRKKSQRKRLLVSMKLLIMKIFPGTLYRCCEVVILTIETFTGATHTGSRPGRVQLCGFFAHPMRGGHWRKSTNGREGSWNRNPQQFFELVG
jgi:hypothetical protein